MPSRTSISAATLNEIARLSEAGSEMYDEGDDAGALACWRKAIALLPMPSQQWDTAVWLHAAIGDALDTAGDAAGAEKAFRAALNASDGQSDAFVQYMVGVLALERGDEPDALDHLRHAYALSGRELFDGPRGERAWAALWVLDAPVTEPRGA
ncbi:hypothetical protein SAMN04489806_2253 [Paramicrobacterium humi]|uniref:Tetratricopeptide repeat-containing protein n=1 Tax=Paramicrobacterium humi TaxID=640635 RepID=A0A1H4NPH7_9MICO|nr:hypothetical protein [Microbacterium humi]SEB96758.1 hypothetical protein SAMN04489806_2253 [Microbacterium humi]